MQLISRGGGNDEKINQTSFRSPPTGAMIRSTPWEMESLEKQKRTILRWPFCSTQGEWVESPRVINVPSLFHEKALDEVSVGGYGDTMENGSEEKMKSPLNWRAGRQIKKLLRFTQSPRKKSDMEDSDTRTTETMSPSDSLGKQSTNWSKRCRSMPLNSGKTMKHESKKHSLKLDSPHSQSLTYNNNLLPRAQSMMTPKSGLVLSPKSFALRKARRRSMKKNVSKPPTIDEEEEEMVGFECIDASKTGLIMSSKVATASMGLLPLTQDPAAETREDNSATRGPSETSEEHQNSKPPTDASDSSAAPLSRTERLLQRLSTVSEEPKEILSFDRFMWSFSTLQDSSVSSGWSRVESLNSSMYGDGSNNLPKKACKAASVRGPLSFFFYSPSSSSDSSEEEEEEVDDDEDDTYSFASNSTISTRASEASLAWGAAVLFNRAEIDAGRDSDSE